MLTTPIRDYLNKKELKTATPFLQRLNQQKREFETKEYMDMMSLAPKIFLEHFFWSPAFLTWNVSFTNWFTLVMLLVNLESFLATSISKENKKP